MRKQTPNACELRTKTDSIQANLRSFFFWLSKSAFISQYRDHMCGLLMFVLIWSHLTGTTSVWNVLSLYVSHTLYNMYLIFCFQRRYFRFLFFASFSYLYTNIRFVAFRFLEIHWMPLFLNRIYVCVTLKLNVQTKDQTSSNKKKNRK